MGITLNDLKRHLELTKMAEQGASLKQLAKISRKNAKMELVGFPDGSAKIIVHPDT